MPQPTLLPKPESRLAVALDYEDLAPALALARRLVGLVKTVKIGPRLFVASGPRALEELAELGFDLFLDLKFHDIPATVGGACRAATALGVRYLTVHVAGGEQMLRAALEGAAEQAAKSTVAAPAILGITVLTSRAVGDPSEVLERARAGRRAGLAGVVASAREAAALRRALDPDALIVTPGIRPAGSAVQDQARVATPAAAIAAGADLLVVGRPITQARDPRAATMALVEQMGSGAS